MKKILALLMTFILAMGLASCGSGGSEAGELTGEASEIKLPEAIDYITDMKEMCIRDRYGTSRQVQWRRCNRH